MIIQPWVIQWRNDNGRKQSAVINARSHKDASKRAKVLGVDTEILSSVAQQNATKEDTK